MSRDWLLYLDDLIESAQKIERFLHAARLESFRNDNLLFAAFLHPQGYASSSSSA